MALPPRRARFGAHVRRGVQLPHEADRIGDVVGLVRRDRSPTAGSALPLRRDHKGRGLALGQAVRDRPRVGDQAVAVLDQQVPEKGQPRFGARRSVPSTVKCSSDISSRSLRIN
jgi:hypothetical protein